MPASAGALRYNGAQPMGQLLTTDVEGDGRCPLEMPRAHRSQGTNRVYCWGYLRNGMLGSDIALDDALGILKVFVTYGT